MNDKQLRTFAQEEEGVGQRKGRSKTPSKKVEETLLLREVEELRTRTVQMEKTMRCVFS